MHENIVFALIHEYPTRKYENVNITGGHEKFVLKSTNPQIVHHRKERMKKLFLTSLASFRSFHGKTTKISCQVHSAYYFSFVQI
jgi:hypothetical protein